MAVAAIVDKPQDVKIRAGINKGADGTKGFRKNRHDL
jgi:hypothetical protein